MDRPNGTLWLGAAEVRVPAHPGVMFAVPSLIWHYITAHSYRPPLEFVEAVRRYDRDWTAGPSSWIPNDAERTTFDRDAIPILRETGHSMLEPSREVPDQLRGMNVS